jgi:hypothetical protein
MYLTDKELRLGASQQNREWGEGYYDHNSTPLRNDGGDTRANGSRLLERPNPTAPDGGHPCG